MQNVLFYGFSTIASMFGSAVGLIVAAAIFRLQRLDQIGSNLGDLLIEHYLPETQKGRMRRVRTLLDWKKLREVYDEAWKDVESKLAPSDEKDAGYLLTLSEKIRDRVWYVRRGIRILVPLTLALIAYCLTGIGMTLCLETKLDWKYWNPICRQHEMVNAYLAVAVGAAIVLLIGYGWLIWMLTPAADYHFKRVKPSENATGQVG